MGNLNVSNVYVFADIGWCVEGKSIGDKEKFGRMNCRIDKMIIGLI
jgi:hypothetical protein